MRKAGYVVGIIIMLLGVLAGCRWGSEPATEIALPVSSPSSPRPLSPPPALSPPPTASPTVPAGPPLAAVVNGQPILLTDFEKQVAHFTAAMVAQGLDLNSEEGRIALAQTRRQVLDVMIDQVLTEQAAAREGVTITDEELEARLQKDIALAGDEARFQQWLTENDLTREEYKALLRSQLLSWAMFERVTSNIPTTAEQVHARHILVDTEDKAQALLAQLQNGADFAALAREHSLDVPTRDNGGDLGWFPRGLLLLPEVEEAAFALAPGQISPVVKSEFGYHIIQVLERDPQRPLGDEVLAEMRNRAFQRWLEELRAAADIQILVPLD